jgi:hypothetical protein
MAVIGALDGINAHSWSKLPGVHGYQTVVEDLAE